MTLVSEMKYLQHVAAFYAMYGVPGVSAIAVGPVRGGQMLVRLWCEEQHESTAGRVQEELDYWHDLPHPVGLRAEIVVGMPGPGDDAEDSFLMFVAPDACGPALVRRPPWLERDIREISGGADDWTIACVVVARAFLGRLDTSVDTASFTVNVGRLAVRLRLLERPDASVDLIRGAVDDLDSWGVATSLSLVDATRVPRGQNEMWHPFYLQAHDE